MIETSRAAIQKGSKSFFLASLFFDPQTKKSCWDLYQWCRHCDDLIDQNPHADQSLQKLYQDWHSYPNCSEPFRVVRSLEAKYQIPEKYFLDLLKGFEWDARQTTFIDIRDVETYAYHVAGTVGLKMCYIMGVSNPRALRHAVDLGIAMQLTNIARDVKEDFERGRVYLPVEWLLEEGIDPKHLFLSSQESSLYQVVLKLLDHADRFYRSGYQGLAYLPWRASLAVSIAGHIYSEIGKKIRSEGPSSLRRRTIVSLPRKCVCALRGAIRVLPLLFQRVARPWRPVSTQDLREIL